MMKSNTIIIALICIVAVATAGTVIVMTKGSDPGQELRSVEVKAYDMTSIPYDPNDPHYYDDPKPVDYYKDGDYTMMVR